MAGKPNDLVGGPRGEAAPPERTSPPEPPQAWPRSLHHEELEAIIRRAAELQFAAGGEEAGVEESELLRIGEEVGLESRFMRQALAERRAAELLPPMPADGGLASRLWGDGFVRVSRAVPGDPPEAEARLVAYLRERESLRAVRERPGRSSWEPATDLASQLQRSFDFGGRGYELAKCRRVELAVEGLEPGRSLVTLTVDVRNRRAAHATVWFGFFSLPAAAAGTALLAGGLEASLALAAPAATGAAAALGGWAAARTFRGRRERVELVVQGVLDRLERGLPLEPSRSGVWRWLDGWR